MHQLGEPSVEEILASIKKVIARDNRVAADEARRDREENGVIHPPSLPILNDPAVDEDAVLDLADEAEFADEQDEAVVAETPLLRPDTRSSISESLAALAMMAEPGVPPQIVRSGETSLEALARELLRPALAEWLDRNLPPLVERMVAAEIARIVGKKG